MAMECELQGLHLLLSKLEFPITMPLSLYRDNKAAIIIAHNLVQHDCTKHIEVDQHFTRKSFFLVLFVLPLLK